MYTSENKHSDDGISIAHQIECGRINVGWVKIAQQEIIVIIQAEIIKEIISQRRKNYIHVKFSTKIRNNDLQNMKKRTSFIGLIIKILEFRYKAVRKWSLHSIIRFRSQRRHKSKLCHVWWVPLAFRQSKYFSEKHMKLNRLKLHSR